ncbi:MAG: FISUMP domain-containing protein [Bacteroidales bacterium]
MKTFTFFLILTGLSLIVPGCKKTDSSDPPVVKDPYAMFTYSIKENGVVSFTNTSTDATSYLWNFGDNTTSTATTVTFEHQYLQNGTYHVTLTAYGNGKSAGAYADLNITTVVSETVTDIDGNVYHTITIGTQVWMVENLKTTKYNDGTSIPLVTDNVEWSTLSTPGYCWYDNDAASPYGALYNWFTVNTGKLAPTGWHVATNAEWTILTTYLGGATVCGGKLKEAGTTHWLSPNEGANNETGFTALPGGYRFSNGSYYYIGERGYWWSSSEYDAMEAWGRGMTSFYSDVNIFMAIKIFGHSVRCVKD